MTPRMDRRDDLPAPRWLQVPVGLLGAAIVSVCLLGAVMLILLPNEAAPRAAPVAGVVMALVALWLLAVCLRLVTGRRAGGGVAGPRTQRVLAWACLVLPLAGLLTGYVRRFPVEAFAQYVACVAAHVTLMRLARRRDGSEPADPPDIV